MFAILVQLNKLNHTRNINALKALKKKSVLQKAARYCDIEELGDKKYRIKKIYKYPIPSSFAKMNKSLYQYIAPLILNYILEGHDEENALILTSTQWCYELRMANQNFNTLRYNPALVCEALNLDKTVVYKIGDRLEYTLRYYLLGTLAYLKDTPCIEWKKVIYITEAILDDLTLKYTSRVATQEDLEYYNHCTAIADATVEISNTKERYFSDKARPWKEVFLKELNKRNITKISEAHAVYYTDLKQCEALLSHFGITDIQELQKLIPENMAALLIDHAKKRVSEGYDTNDYVEQTEIISNYCINSHTG